MTPLWTREVEERIRAEAKNLDSQTRPKEVKYCRSCVISNQRPRIVFDNSGLCSACLYSTWKHDGIPWDARHDKLVSLLSKHRKKSGYDVIVPCSGGKDSSMVAYRLKHDYRMRPLCLKWAPFIYTDIGRKNFEALVHSGFDAMIMYPNGLLHRKLSRLALEYYGDCFMPFVYGQLAYPIRMAVKFGIQLVFGAESGEAEYGGDVSANDRPCWDFQEWDRVYSKGVSFSRLLDIGVNLGAISETERVDASEFYSLPDRNILDASGVQYHWFSYYHNHHPMENFYFASEKTGFQVNPEGRSEGTYSKFASLDDATDGFHYYFGFLKFGIGRATSDAAQQVRAGDITRDEAVALVRRYDGEFPAKHYATFKEYLGLDDEQFQKIVDRFRPEHLWEKKDGTWWLRHCVGDAG